ncbi:MAG: hypothetical protein ACREBU_09485, partial [Nitrososphaera sp.]
MISNIRHGMFLGLASVLVTSTIWLMVPSPAFFFVPQQAMALNDTQYVSQNDGSDSFGPQIAVSGSNVFVVWQDFSIDNEGIFFSSSSDDGTTFSNPINISNDGSSSNPQIAVSGSNVFVVWQDNDEILFASSSDNGANFSDIVNISQNDV